MDGHFSFDCTGGDVLSWVHSIDVLLLLLLVVKVGEVQLVPVSDIIFILAADSHSLLIGYLVLFVDVLFTLD